MTKGSEVSEVRRYVRSRGDCKDHATPSGMRYVGPFAEVWRLGSESGRWVSGDVYVCPACGGKVVFEERE